MYQLTIIVNEEVIFTGAFKDYNTYCAIHNIFEYKYDDYERTRKTDFDATIIEYKKDN